MVSRVGRMKTATRRAAAIVAIAIACGDADGVDPGTSSEGNGTTSTGTVGATSTWSGTSAGSESSAGAVESGDPDTTGPSSCDPGVGAGEVVWKVDTNGRGNDVAVDPDGRAIVAGTISGDGPDGWVASYDTSGGLSWEHSATDPREDSADLALVTSSGSYVIAGVHIDELGKPGMPVQQIESWIREYSVDGRNQWSLEPSGEKGIVETVVALDEDIDGARVLVTQRAEDPLASFGVVRRISPAGELSSSTELAWDDDGADAGPSARGGTLVPGGTSDIIVVGNASADRWAARTSQAGEVVWNMRWPCRSSCELVAIAAASDGGFVVAGAVPPEAPNDPWVGSLGSDGQLGWEVSWGAPTDWERVRGVAVAPDGTIVVAGTTNVTSEAVDRDEGWVRKLSPTGELMWETVLTHEMPSGSLSVSNVATGGDCDGIAIIGGESFQGQATSFLAYLAP